MRFVCTASSEDSYLLSARRPYQGAGFSFTDPVAGIDKDLNSTRRITRIRSECEPGKVQSTDDFELSTDLQTLTETQHHPDQGKPIILVFKRVAKELGT
jgi:hypothetical protein